MALRQFAAQAATTLRVRCGPRVHSGFSVPLVRTMSTDTVALESGPNDVLGQISQAVYAYVLENLKYAPSHEWVRVEGDVAYVGITDHAQTELGDVVHVEVKAAIDEKVTKGTPFAVVESVKAASDVYAPISGTIVEVNDTLDGSKSPELVNKSPFEEGWFAKIKLSDPSELDTLLGSKAYEEHVEATAH